eukprot:gene5095-6339_t
MTSSYLLDTINNNNQVKSNNSNNNLSQNEQNTHILKTSPSIPINNRSTLIDSSPPTTTTTTTTTTSPHAPNSNLPSPTTISSPILINGIPNTNNNNPSSSSPSSVTESQLEYSLCGLFSILYPFSSNFTNNNNNNNKNSNNNEDDSSSSESEGSEPFIPTLTNPVTWSDITDMSESLYSSSPTSSYSSIGDIQMRNLDYTNQEDDTESFYNTNSTSISKNKKKHHNRKQSPLTTNNNRKKKSVVDKTPPPSTSTSPSSSKSTSPKNGTNQKSKPIGKKLFIGGIKFDDISSEEDCHLKQLRIEKLLSLFHSLGKIDSIDPSWDKGPKTADRVVETFSNPNNKFRYLQGIKESLLLEGKDIRATPLPNLYASADQISECFSIFDKDNDGKVSIEDLGAVLRSLGKSPTSAEIEALKTEVGTKEFDLNTLKTLYKGKPIKTPSDLNKEMLDAFKALDKEGHGTIQEAELRQLLTTLGDYLTTAETEELMKEVSVNSDGAISYQQFVEMLVNGHPLSNF